MNENILFTITRFVIQARVEMISIFHAHLCMRARVCNLAGKTVTMLFI